MASEAHDLVQRFVAARTREDRAVLEGYHPLKHALRFDAPVLEVVVAESIDDSTLPPELAGTGIEPRRVEDEVFGRLVTRSPPLAVVALAARPSGRIGTVLDDRGRSPVVLLEHPSHAGNLGAAVRVAAAAGAGGLASIGDLDPWSPTALRGGAGLQYALPVGRLDGLGPVTGSPRPLVAFDPEGDDLRDVAAPAGAVLAFGTERRGLSDVLRRRADHLVRIPMRPRVSSLNLATAVAVALYAFTDAAGDV